MRLQVNKLKSTCYVMSCHVNIQAIKLTSTMNGDAVKLEGLQQSALLAMSSEACVFGNIVKNVFKNILN